MVIFDRVTTTVDFKGLPSGTVGTIRDEIGDKYVIQHDYTDKFIYAAIPKTYVRLATAEEVQIATKITRPEHNCGVCYKAKTNPKLQVCILEKKKSINEMNDIITIEIDEQNIKYKLKDFLDNFEIIIDIEKEAEDFVNAYPQLFRQEQITINEGDQLILNNIRFDILDTKVKLEFDVKEIDEIIVALNKLNKLLKG